MVPRYAREAPARLLGALGEHAKEHAGAVGCQARLEHRIIMVMTRKAAVRRALGALRTHAKEHVGAIATTSREQEH